MMILINEILVPFGKHVFASFSMLAILAGKATKQYTGLYT